MRIALISLIALAGCLPPSSSSSFVRGTIWAQPGSPTVFAWTLRETTTSQKFLETDHSDPAKSTHWVEHTSTVVDRTWVSTIDPTTGESSQLAAVNGAVKPFYWDAQRSILWVYDDQSSVVGLSPSGLVHAPGTSANLERRRDLPPPFAVAELGTDVLLFNARTQSIVTLDRHAGYGAPTLDGSLLRLTRSAVRDGALVVDQTVVDTANGVRLADVAWRSPPLPGWMGTHDAVGVLPDGRRVAEMVTTADGTRVFIHDMLQGGPPIVVAMPSPPPGVSRLEVVALAEDVLFAGRRLLVDKRVCWRGSMISVRHRRVVPIPEEPCIQAVDGEPGRRWLKLDATSAYLDASLRIVDLGVRLDAPLVIDRTTIAFSRPDSRGGVGVVKLDLSTGTLTSLGVHADPADTLLNVTGTTMTFLSGADRLVTQRGALAAPAVALPGLVEHGPDGPSRPYETAGVGTRPEPTKVWLGAGVGATSGGELAAGISVDVQHWIADRWTLAVGFAARSVEMESMRRLDMLGRVGLTWFSVPRIGGWFAGLDLGAGRSDLKVEKTVIDQSFVASAALRAGHQGGLITLDIAASAPSLFDPDRGLAVLGEITFGVFGLNR